MQGRSLTETLEAVRFAGKLTWQPSAAQRLNLSAFGKRYDLEQYNPAAIGLQGGRRERDARSLSLAWDGTYGSRWQVEAVAGRFEVEESLKTLDDSVPAYLDFTPASDWASQQDCGDTSALQEVGAIWFTPTCVGGPEIFDPADPIRDQLRGSVTWFAARHEVKVGGAAVEQRNEMGNRYPGPFAAPLIDADGVEVDPEGSVGAVFVLETDSYTMETFGTVGRPWSDEHAVFVEDRFKPSAHLTLELGLRAEAYRGRVRETPGDQHELDFGLDELIAPRLGVVWDFARNGRSRLFGRIGRYYESLPLQTSLIAFGPTSEVFRTFAYPADGSLPTYTNLGVLAFSEDVITDPMPVVPGTQQTHTDEASAGMEYELVQGLAVGLNLVYRELRDVIDTFSFDESFVLGNPGGHHTVHPVTGETLEEPADYDEPVNEYRAVEVTVRRPLRDRWQLFASYVYAESQGNYSGSDGGAHASEQFDFPRLTEGGFGRLPGDRPHQLKAYGSYALPFGLVTGFVGQYYSGTPINKYGFWPDFYERFVETRGSAGRTPDTWWADLHLAYTVPLSGDAVELDLVFEALNVTDEQGVFRVDELWTFAQGDGLNPGECGGADPTCVDEDGHPIGNDNWGQPTDFQLGRNLRFGLKLRW